MHEILLVGNDLWLLKTRALLLKGPEAEVFTSSPFEFAQNAANQQIELLVLCHSLDLDLRLLVSAEVRRRWPEVRVLQLLSDSYEGASTSEYADDAVLSCHPDELVNHARTLLNDPATSYSRKRLIQKTTESVFPAVQAPRFRVG
jgi:hypothetical protein